MKRLLPLFLALLFAATLLHADPQIVPHETGADREVFTKQIQPLLRDFCLDCHSTAEQKGDLDLETFDSLDSIRKHPKIWQNVAEQLANGEMPPKKKPQPKPEEKERLAKWVMAMLDEMARARAGDPGPVVLRRLSNAEYTYTLRDLTGLPTLDPAKEFPVDGAAGEGFTNTGQALVMSPALITKYLDAAKEVASHAVLLPDGLRFSPSTTRRDWTQEIVGQIRDFYGAFTDAREGASRAVQGVAVDTKNEGGRLPIEKYLTATIEERTALAGGPKSAEAISHERGLNARYLSTLFAALSGGEPSMLLDRVRSRWSAAKAADVPAIATEIAQWQKALWRFNSVGHIGKAGGPKSWMEPVTPIASQQELRMKLPASTDGKEVVLYLTATDAGDGSEGDVVVWRQPRLVAPGRTDLLLRDVRAVSQAIEERRQRFFASTAKCLAAAAEASAGEGKADTAELARKHQVDAEALSSWLGFLGIGGGSTLRVEGHLAEKVTNSGQYAFIKGWRTGDLPSLLANSSDETVRIPGLMKPHSVAVHPTPQQQVGVGWQSPQAAAMRIEGAVTHAHPECGNGVTWSLELRRGGTRQRLASGIAQGAKEVKVGPLENVAVQQGDLLSLLIGPRDGNHSCDLTTIDLTLATIGADGKTWNLATDLTPDVLAGNPHADRFGNAGVWHFYAEPDGGGSSGAAVIAAGSILAKWQASGSAEEKRQLAAQLQALLTAGVPPAKDSPDAPLYQQLTSLGGPLFSGDVSRLVKDRGEIAADDTGNALRFGLDPNVFGQGPDGRKIAPTDLSVRAPAVIEIRLPAELAAGCEFVTTGTLDPQSGAEGSVQMQLLTTKPEAGSGLVTSNAKIEQTDAAWVDTRPIAFTAPIVVNDGSAARRKVEAAFKAHRDLFPAALSYTKIVPVDEVVTLTLFYREDDQLVRLMLDDRQKAQLDKLWDELRFVSRDALTLVDAFEQIWQYSTQDGPDAPHGDKRLEPLRKPINDNAAALRARLVATEPRHVEAALEFADRAFRRPLSAGEQQELRGLYQKLRAQELSHEEAIQLTLARILIAPAFLYRAENPGAGKKQQPVSDSELASRLSYFLWSSMPDAELRGLADAGKLRDPAVIIAQTRRMLADERARRLAMEFGCQWLHIRDFDTLDEKSERHFPEFTALRASMYEESIRFFTDFFQHDRSVLALLDSDHTFLNEALAKHYEIPGVTGEQWRHVDGVKKFGRGGILAQATTLAKQSGASRTSPILRGNWVAEALLGDKLPRPPKDVPQLPEDEAVETLTVRQLTEKHSTDPRCYGCHQRIDAFGFALESFDAIGRRREKDLGGRVIDTHAKTMDGAEFTGVEGLRNYLLTRRRDAFLRQFCRKLLGYSLGRAVQLSDELLLNEMQAQLAANNYRVHHAIEMIVRSRQFGEIRGRDADHEE